MFPVYENIHLCEKYLYLEAQLQDWEHYIAKSLLICILHLVLWNIFNLQPAKFHIRHDHNLQTGCEKFRSRQLHTGESVIDQDMYLTKIFIASLKLKFIMSLINFNFNGLQIVSQASCEDKDARFRGVCVHIVPLVWCVA
jgi:hypothetical protein